jgi:hypothetical protein
MAPRRLGILGLVLTLTSGAAFAAKPDASSASTTPDPATVERFGPAYRYPKAGWIVIHIEGKPYDRGYQHGRLLAHEIAEYINTLAVKRSPTEPGKAWMGVRTLANALFLRRFDSEYLEEMKGIADGAAAGGARFDGRPVDLIDIVCVNAEIEVDFLDSALHATATGLEAQRFSEPEDTSPAPTPPEHCSAFAATGPATADGKIVFGHITMWSIPFVQYFNVWLDIKPERGQRVLMQTYPGGIMSGMDYYLNDAGLIVTETTITQTKFDIEGRSLASRIRKALQYCNSIDGVVGTLRAMNNGMYTNEWLIADTKTNEIAMFELGTHKWRLWRSSRREWFGGTEGFYWGCNNTKDIAVRLETVPTVDGKPANVVFHPSDRDRTWLRLYQKHKGKIAEGFGFEAYSTPPLVAHPSCDAKFTTSALARELRTWARFGPPMGRTWEPTEDERARCPTVQPLVSNDWTILAPVAPSDGDGSSSTPRVADHRGIEDSASGTGPTRAETGVLRRTASGRNAANGSDRRGKPYKPLAVDLGTSTKPALGPSVLDSAGELSPAWRGTLLPAADGDTWLAAAFADYQSIVARDRARIAKSTGHKLNRTDSDHRALDLFTAHSAYMTGCARWGRDVALVDIRSELEHGDWYAVASGKGVLLLAELRDRMGDDKFLKFMDEFGRAHAGQAVTTAMFKQAVDAVPGTPVDPAELDRWLTKTGLPAKRFAGTWSVDSFLSEPEKSLIVYGTQKEEHAQREAAELLQRHVARLWSNILIPIRADAEVREDELASHHVLVIGRPDSNSIAAKYAVKSIPVQFGPASFVAASDTYGNADSAVIAAGSNPLSARYELVLFAGLGARDAKFGPAHRGARAAVRGTDPRRGFQTPPPRRFTGRASAARTAHQDAGRRVRAIAQCSAA